MPNVSQSTAVLAVSAVIALAVIAATTILTYSGKMDSGTFEATVLVILAAFGVTGAVHATSSAISNNNGHGTTVVPISPSGEVGAVQYTAGTPSTIVPVTEAHPVQTSAMPQGGTP